MASFRETVKKILRYVEEHRISSATIKLIPYVGDAIDELINGGDIEKLIETVAQETESRQNEIIEFLNRLIDDKTETKTPVIICVGGGNAEEILKLEEELIIDGFVKR